MRTLYWYLTGFLFKHGWKVAVSIFFGVLIFSFLVPFAARRLKLTERRYIGVIGNHTLTTLPDSIQQKLSSGLTEIAEDGSARGVLAERWTIEQEDKTYRFQIKKNIRWMDGSALSPEDVQYVFPDVQIITTPNDVIFRLPEPYAPFPTLVQKPIFKSGTKQHWYFWEQPTLVGLGPYQIVDFKQNGTRLRELVIENEAERLVYRFYTTEDEAVVAYKRGEVDELPDLIRQFDIMTWNTSETAQNLDYWKYLAVFFNTRDPLMTKNVRQALSYAVTKPTDEVRALGPISPLSWAYLPGGKTYEKDWQRGVERLLDEPPQQQLSFTLTTTPEYQLRAEQLKNEWESFGEYSVQFCESAKSITDKNVCDNLALTVNVLVQSVPDTSNYQLLLIGKEIDPDPDQYTMWHSDQPSNVTGYKNTRIDSLLERGRKSTDQSDRKQLYQEFQQFLLEDPPAIFLEFITRYEVKRRSVFG